MFGSVTNALSKGFLFLARQEVELPLILLYFSKFETLRRMQFLCFVLDFGFCFHIPQHFHLCLT